MTIVFGQLLIFNTFHLKFYEQIINNNSHKKYCLFDKQ